MKKTLEQFLEEITGCQVDIVKECDADEDCQEIEIGSNTYLIKIRTTKTQRDGYHYMLSAKNTDMEEAVQVVKNLMPDASVSKLRDYIAISLKNEDIMEEDLIKTIEGEIYGAVKVMDIGYMKRGEDLEEYLEIAQKTLSDESIVQKTIYNLRDYLNKKIIENTDYEDVKKYIFKRNSPEKLDQDTIRAGMSFIENSMNISKTSSKLYIHRNTLLYRLDKIKEHLGLDIRTFNDAKDFYFGIQIYNKNKRF